MKKRWMKIPLVIAAVTVGTFAFSELVMLLWNGILPAVLHVGAITMWQAAGILLLSKILFGSFRRPGMADGWKRRMQMRDMSPEDREKMWSKMRGCRGRGGFDEEPA